MREDQRTAALLLAPLLEQTFGPRWVHVHAAAALLRELAAEPVQEPVAWGQIGMLNGHLYLREKYDRTPYPPPADVLRNLNLVPLYTHPQRPPCIGRDPLCPCQDGDSCHYKDTPTTKGWPIP